MLYSCVKRYVYFKKLTSVLSFNVLKNENIYFLSYVSLFSNAESGVESNYLNYFQLPGSSTKNCRLSAQNSNLSFSRGFLQRTVSADLHFDSSK